jgi:dephospho-CoA kinase
MFVIGLTGSIGMGKTTTAGFFADEGVPVHDADATVHRLYEGAAASVIETVFPGTTDGGKVDRAKLATRVLNDPAALKQLETIVHPMVRDAEIRFLAEAEQKGTPVVVLDIPLLFETKGEERVDAVVTVTAPGDIQRARLLARPGLTAEKLETLIANQLPDAEKRRRADFILDSSQGFDAARMQVKDILRQIAKMPKRRR